MPVSCVAVRLNGGRTWYCRNEGDRRTPVLRISAGGESTVAVGLLHAGDRIVIPSGDGLESVHARLLAASRTNAEVGSLEIILSQFRAAARDVLAHHATKVAACEAVRLAGAVAANQLASWADGTTIAPREPGDVAAVFRAAGRAVPDLDLLYAVASQLRKLGSALRRFAEALAINRGHTATDRLRELVGPTAGEILDEFEVAVVTGVGDTREVPASLAGRVR